MDELLVNKIGKTNRGEIRKKGNDGSRPDRWGEKKRGR
jgi:hypothetical protein